MSQSSSNTPRGKSSMRLLFGSMIVAAAAIGAQPAIAAGGDNHHRGDHGEHHRGGHGEMFGGAQRHLDHMLDAVDATDAQRAQIKQISAAARTDMKTRHAASRSLREQARQVMTAPTIDVNAAEQLRLQMLAQHDQLSQLRLKTMLDIAQVLTPEQRGKIGAMMAKRSDRMHERMKRHHGGDAAPKS